jgi:hypothetical protein
MPLQWLGAEVPPRPIALRTGNANHRQRILAKSPSVLAHRPPSSISASAKMTSERQQCPMNPTTAPPGNSRRDFRPAADEHPCRVRRLSREPSPQCRRGQRTDGTAGRETAGKDRQTGKDACGSCRLNMPKRVTDEAATERPTGSPASQHQAFPQPAWTHAQRPEGRAWGSRERTMLDAHKPKTLSACSRVISFRSPGNCHPARVLCLLRLQAYPGLTGVSR